MIKTREINLVFICFVGNYHACIVYIYVYMSNVRVPLNCIAFAGEPKIKSRNCQTALPSMHWNQFNNIRIYKMRVTGGEGKL